MARYQDGSLEKVKTAAGAWWYIRFTLPDGKRPRLRVGSVADLPTKAKASRAAQPLREAFNAAPGKLLQKPRTFREVIERYEREELPARPSTARGYKNIHRNHIEPRWGSTPLAEITPMAVRSWLLALPLATRTRGHIHGQMRVLFRFAMFWEWTQLAANPMNLFTIAGSSKRTRTPKIITPEQFQQMLEIEHASDRRAMLIASFCLGLRVSELLGLRWSDFDHLSRKVTISRAIVSGQVGDVKTERSGACLPLPRIVDEAFLRWRHEYTEIWGSPASRAGLAETRDWVFLGKTGKVPPNTSWLQDNWLKPLGKKIDLPFPLGWHTFRHSFKTLLVTAGIEVTLQRDLMRHADIQTTMQTYGENTLEPLREASDKALAKLFPA